MPDQVDYVENVVSVSFDRDDAAYAALSKLKELDAQGQIGLRAAAVVVRGDDGQLAVKDEISDNGVSGTATGGIIGLLIGVLFGPVGILIGGATGLLVGEVFDLDDDDDTESVLSDLSRHVRADHATLLAEVGEPSAEVIDAAMASLGGNVLRRSVADVEAEIAAAEAAQKAARKKAREVLREQRRTNRRDEIRAKIESLKARLARGASKAKALA